MSNAAEVTSTQRPGLAYASLSLLLLCLINAFSYIDRSLLALVMPELSKELQLSDTVMGLVAGLPFALCFTLCAIPIAWVADNFNRRNLLAAALAFWSLVTLLTGAVQNGWQLAVARFGLGAGEAAGHPTMSSLIADTFDVKLRTIAFSALAASAFVGPLVGFPVVGWLMENYGWRTAYYVAGSGGLVMAVVFIVVVKEPPRKKVVAKKDRVPTIEAAKTLLAIPSYRWVIIAGGFNAINHGAHLTWVPTFLDRMHGLGFQEVGLLFGSLRGITGLAGALFAALVVGALVRKDIRWQLRMTILLGALPFATDLLFLFSDDPTLWRTGLALTAFFSSAIHALFYPLFVNVAPSNLRAMATAMYFLIASLTGLMLGPFLVGFLNDVLSPQFGLGAIAISMSIASSTAIISAGLLVLAGRTWMTDLKKVEE